MVYLYSGLLFRLKKEKQNQKKVILPFATTRLKPEGIALGEVSRSQKDTNCVTPLPGGIALSPTQGTENGVAGASGGGKEGAMGSCCSVGITFQFCRMKRFWRCTGPRRPQLTIWRCALHILLRGAILCWGPTPKSKQQHTKRGTRKLFEVMDTCVSYMDHCVGVMVDAHVQMHPFVYMKCVPLGVHQLHLNKAATKI